jgi:hypothetical protein
VHLAAFLQAQNPPGLYWRHHRTLPSRTNGPRCCLRDSQGDTIKFDPNGVAYRMDNYAIVEEITLN